MPHSPNTRVIHIVRELETFGVRAHVHDPLADPATLEREYGIRLYAMDELPPANAVVLAVPHHCYRDAGWPMVAGLLEASRGHVADVRSCLDRAATPAGVTLWRL